MDHTVYKPLLPNSLLMQALEIAPILPSEGMTTSAGGTLHANNIWTSGPVLEWVDGLCMTHHIPSG
jgi:hypothetical protein